MRGRVHKPSRWRWPELSASQPNLRFHCPILALICLGFLHSGSFGVVHVLWEISSVYAWKFREISPTLVLVPSAYSKTKLRKQTNGSTGFKNQGASKIYSNSNLISPWYLLKQSWTKITLTWVCCATLIQNHVLPFHLNSVDTGFW